MKIIINYVVVFVLVVTAFSCGSDDDAVITPTQNTAEYFKYSIDNGPVRIFDLTAKGTHSTNANSLSERFAFRAGAGTANGSSVFVDADFTFQDFNAFLSTNTFDWGVSDGTSNNFYFYELSNSHPFVPSGVDFPPNPVVCTVTLHPTNVGDYLEFSFEGDFLYASDLSIQGFVSGEGRILRE